MLLDSPGFGNFGKRALVELIVHVRLFDNLRCVSSECIWLEKSVLLLRLGEILDVLNQNIKFSPTT